MGDQLTENIKALDDNIINIVVTNEKVDTVNEPTDKTNTKKIRNQLSVDVVVITLIGTKQDT